MGKACLAVFAVIMAVASAIDLQRIKRYPNPMKHFDPDRYGGYWYTQARYVACSWYGSAAFTDFTYKVSPRQNSYVTNSYWRNRDMCTDVVSLTPVKSTGIFSQSDPIGDIYSGTWYIVATDYKRFSVSWGCTKDFAGQCKDPYISVDTRKPHPNKKCLEIIETILEHQFGLKLHDLVPMVHKKTCIPTHKH